jgi:hypothetical protein
MLPSIPRIQPVKGGVLRDSISAGWGNGLVSELHLPQESGVFYHQNVGPLAYHGQQAYFFDVFGKVESTFGPHNWYACGHVFHGSQNSPDLYRLACDQMFAYLVTDEMLSTEDYTNYQSVHGTSGSSMSDWLKEPSPVITVNGSVKTEFTDYNVDYENGMITFATSIKGNTLLTANATSGTTTLHVSSSVGFEAGDCITVKGNQSIQDEICSVSQVTNSITIQLNENLVYSHNSGLAVIEVEPVVKATYRYIEQHQSKQETSPLAGSPDGLVYSFIENSEKSNGSYGLLRLKNPAFLNWTDGMPDSWELDGSGVALITSSSQSLFGDATVQLENTAQTGFRYLKQTISCNTPRDVFLSCWVNTTGKAKIEIIPTSGTSAHTILDVTANQPMAPFSGKWVRLGLLCQGQPPYQIRLYGQATENDGGVVRFDGVFLLEV